MIPFHNSSNGIKQSDKFYQLENAIGLEQLSEIMVEFAEIYN
jgi:hypothetical protein